MKGEVHELNMIKSSIVYFWVNPIKVNNALSELRFVATVTTGGRVKFVPTV